MSLDPSNDVLVVGAGPVGLTMACELARSGVRCRIIDKADVPASTSRALAIFPRTLEMFEMMGISEQVLKAGHQLNGVAIHNESGQIGHIGFSNLASRYRFAISLPQTETERLLIEHLAGFGIEVERGKELVALSPLGNAIQAMASDAAGVEERSVSNWLIGCDGAHSSVRHLLDLPFEGEAYPENFLLADVKIDGPLDDIHIHLFLTGKGLVGIFPFKGERCRVIVDTHGSESAPVGDLQFEEIEAIVESRTNAGIRISDPVWLSRFRISHHKVPNFRVGRVFLAGDSAHIHSPAGGQGMNTGIQDACNLAWKLALVVLKKSPESLLNSYNEEREPVAKMVLSLTDRLTRMATLQGAIGQQLRDALLPMLTGIDVVEDRIAETVAEIGIHYRRSSIVSGKSGHAIHAGDRAPDCELQRGVDRQPLRLFELLGKPVHHLFFFLGKADADLTSHSESLRVTIGREYKGLIDVYLVVRGSLANFSDVLFDRDSTMHALYEAEPGAIVLIRPDGYLGFRSGAKHLDSLREQLARIFLSENLQGP